MKYFWLFDGNISDTFLQYSVLFRNLSIYYSTLTSYHFTSDTGSLIIGKKCFELVKGILWK